jgi:hypothetical protein
MFLRNVCRYLEGPRSRWGVVHTLKSSQRGKKGLEPLSPVGEETGTSREVEIGPEMLEGG